MSDRFAKTLLQTILAMATIVVLAAIMGLLYYAAVRWTLIVAVGMFGAFLFSVFWVLGGEDDNDV